MLSLYSLKCSFIVTLPGKKLCECTLPMLYELNEGKSTYICAGSKTWESWLLEHRPNICSENSSGICWSLEKNSTQKCHETAFELGRSWKVKVIYLSNQPEIQVATQGRFKKVRSEDWTFILDVAAIFHVCSEPIFFFFFCRVGSWQESQILSWVIQESVFSDVSYIWFPLEVEWEIDAQWTCQACGLTENTIAHHYRRMFMVYSGPMKRYKLGLESFPVFRANSTFIKLCDQDQMRGLLLDSGHPDFCWSYHNCLHDCRHNS